MPKLGLRYATKLAENHAAGILESTDDGSFWGEDFYFNHEDDWETLQRAREIVIGRINRKKAKLRVSRPSMFY